MNANEYGLLILDYGGTYSFEYDINAYPSIMTKAFGRVPSESEQALIAPLSHKLAEGSIATEAYVAQVARIMNVATPGVEVFENATLEVTHDPSPEMKSLVKHVRESGIRVSLLSNMYFFEVNKTRASARYDGFDYVAFSAEAGMTKQDPAFFLQTLHHFGVPPEKALFVDDIPAYTAVAASLGIRTITADKERFGSAGELAEAIYSELGI